jgi:hypothetical protein
VSGMRRKLQGTGAATAAAVAAAAAIAAGAADGTTGKRSDFDLGFSTRVPGRHAALTLHVVYKAANDPNAKPSPIRKVVVAAPAGTRFDTAAVPACTASDQQLMVQGSGACPKESRIGGGKLVAITGFGPPVDPATADLTLFNTGKEILEVVTVSGTDRVLGSDRLAIDGSTLTADPPKTPGGPPDGETAVRQIDFTIDRATGFVTTPRSCPAARRWTSTGTFGFADGAEETLTSVAACDRPAPAGRRARLTLSPRRVEAGEPARFTARVIGAPAGCRRGAVVRIAGRHARTGADGHATLTATPGRAGLHRATATKRGCRTLAALFWATD